MRLVDRKVQGDTRASKLEVYTLGAYESGKTYNIYSFDVETEKIKSQLSPPGLKTPSLNLRLAELGNFLCLTDNIHRWNVYINKYGG